MLRYSDCAKSFLSNCCIIRHSHTFFMRDPGNLVYQEKQYGLPLLSVFLYAWVCNLGCNSAFLLSGNYNFSVENVCISKVSNLFYVPHNSLSLSSLALSRGAENLPLELVNELLLRVGLCFFFNFLITKALIYFPSLFTGFEESILLGLKHNQHTQTNGNK